jgi:hypothetical protein
MRAHHARICSLVMILLAQVGGSWGHARVPSRLSLPALSQAVQVAWMPIRPNHRGF